MNFEDLKRFLQEVMDVRQANYQPVMIKTLIQNNGKATKQQIQEELHKANPQFSVTYFSNSPVFDVLTKDHKVAKYVENEKMFYLLGYETFKSSEKNHITMLCEKKINGDQEKILDEIGKQFQDWMNSGGAELLKEHFTHVRFIHERLAKEKIQNMQESDLIEIYGELWSNNNFRNKEWRCREKIIKPNGMEKIRKELLNLLYGEEPISERYDNCKKNLNGVGKSTITELLYCFSSQKYCLWNNAADIVLEKLGLDKIIEIGKTDGEKYEKMIALYTDIVNRLQKYGMNDFFQLDTFLYYKFRKNEFTERQIRETNGVSFWKVAPGEQARDWDYLKSLGIVGIGWNDLGDLKDLPFEQVHDKIKTSTYHSSISKVSPQFRDYLSIKKGDIIIANKGQSKIVGAGRVVGNYQYKPELKYAHTYPVEWFYSEEKEIPYQDGWRITVKPVSKEDAEKWLSETEPEIENIKQKLIQNKQIVLYGPPGTSKTHTAKKIAVSLFNPNVNDENLAKLFDELNYDGKIELVQFHPSYSYEDFVQGIKPNVKDGKIIYEVRDGIFKKLCQSTDSEEGVDYEARVEKFELIKTPISADDIGVRFHGPGINKIEKEKLLKLIKKIKSNGQELVNLNEFENITHFFFSFELYPVRVDVGSKMCFPHLEQN